MCFPDGASGEEPTCQFSGDVRDSGSIPGSGKSPGGGNGNPLQYSCIENLIGKEWDVTEVTHTHAKL